MGGRFKRIPVRRGLPGGCDYDLYLYHVAGEEIVAASQRTQDGTQEPWEALSYTNPSSVYRYYDILIAEFGSPSPVNFHLYSYYHELQWKVAERSCIVPADSANAVAVGAVGYYLPGVIQRWSSRGPTDDGRIKPDIVINE